MPDTPEKLVTHLVSMQVRTWSVQVTHLRSKEAKNTTTVAEPYSMRKATSVAYSGTNLGVGWLEKVYQRMLSTALRNLTPCRSNTMQKVLVTGELFEFI